MADFLAVYMADVLTVPMTVCMAKSNHMTVCLTVLADRTAD